MTANDIPFNPGDKVAIIRHRHGWEDGNLTGTVMSRYQNEQGTWNYQVMVDRGEDSYQVEVNHTRDLSKIS